MLPSELILRQGWTQGCMAKEGRFCTIGALFYSSLQSRAQSMYTAVQDIIQAKGGVAVSTWNDSLPATTGAATVYGVLWAAELLHRPHLALPPGQPAMPAIDLAQVVAARPIAGASDTEPRSGTLRPTIRYTGPIGGLDAMLDEATADEAQDAYYRRHGRYSDHQRDNQESTCTMPGCNRPMRHPCGACDYMPSDGPPRSFHDGSQGFRFQTWGA